MFSNQVTKVQLLKKKLLSLSNLVTYVHTKTIKVHWKRRFACFAITSAAACKMSLIKSCSTSKVQYHDVVLRLHCLNLTFTCNDSAA